MFRARGCSSEESADLAQEAAIRAFMHIRRWGVAGAGLDPLLNRIARNLLIDRYRRVVPHIVPLENANEIGDPSQDPSEEVARRHRHSAVQSAIRSLPVRHRKAITYSLSGLSPEEVGKQLGIGRNAADALLHRARRSLREHLAPVRDGMWGLAIGFQMRWDRLTRRAGIDDRVAEGSFSALASSAGAAAAALVAVLAVTGAASSASPGAATANANFAGFAPATVIDGRYSQAPAAADLGAGGAGGGSIGGSGRSAWSFGSVAGGSIGRDGSDATVNGPRDPITGRPMVWIQQHQYGKDAPADDRVARTLNKGLDRTCRVVTKPCAALDGSR